MKYESWLPEVPEEITGDALWTVGAYRLSLFVSDVAWHDAAKLVSDKRTLELSDQLYRAVGSIGANLAEGYSRGSRKDRARFYEYALGSARESRDWYYKARHVLGGTVAGHRLRLLTQIIRLLLTMVPQQRGYALHEADAVYEVDSDSSEAEPPLDPEELQRLLWQVPLP